MLAAVALFARPGFANTDVEQPAATSIEKQPITRKPSAVTKTRATTQKTGANASAGGSSAFDAGQVAWALGVVLVVILVARVIAKRYFGVTGAARGTRAVQVLSRSPVSPRQQLVLLRVGRRLLVVADGGGQMTTLSEITDADEVAALIGQVREDHGDRASKSFGSLFGKMRGKYETDDGNRDVDGDVEPIFPMAAGVQGRLFDKNDDPDDPAVRSTRQELSGLMDKVRMLSRQFKS
jgi:flagellar biogenesis protein FliO